jgi:hypothetical protein
MVTAHALSANCRAHFNTTKRPPSTSRNPASVSASMDAIVVAGCAEAVDDEGCFNGILRSYDHTQALGAGLA